MKTSSALTGRGDRIAFLVGGDVIDVCRDELMANNTYFRRFLRQHPGCTEVRLHHVRYASSEAALRLCENGQDDPYFRICRRLTEAKDDVARAQRHAAGVGAGGRGVKGHASAVEDAEREYRSRFKDILSLVESCILYGLHWHADRAALVAGAHLLEPSHVRLGLRTALSLCHTVPDLVEQVTRGYHTRDTAKDPAVRLLIACLHQLRRQPALSQPDGADAKSEAHWDGLAAQYPVLLELLHLTLADTADTPDVPSPAGRSARHAVNEARGSQRPVTGANRGSDKAVTSRLSAQRDPFAPFSLARTSLTTPPASAPEESPEVEKRAARLVAQLRPIVRSLERTVAREAAEHERVLEALDGRQLHALQDSLAASRASLCELTGRVASERQLQEEAQAALVERRDAWLAQCQYAEDADIYVTALATAAEEMMAFISTSKAALQEAPRSSDAPPTVTESCVTLYANRARELRGEREVVLRRIAAEETEQEERETHIATLTRL